MKIQTEYERNVARRRRPPAQLRGAAAVEFALLLPLLALLALGSIDVAYSINVAQTINDASREAARQATRTEVTDVGEVEAFVEQYIADAFPSTSAGTLSSAVVVDVRDEDGNVPPNGDLTQIESGGSVAVQVQMQFGAVQLTRFIPGFEQITIQTTTVMRRE